MLLLRTYKYHHLQYLIEHSKPTTSGWELPPEEQYYWMRGKTPQPETPECESKGYERNKDNNSPKMEEEKAEGFHSNIMDLFNFSPFFSLSTTLHDFVLLVNSFALHLPEVDPVDDGGYEFMNWLYCFGSLLVILTSNCTYTLIHVYIKMYRCICINVISAFLGVRVSFLSRKSFLFSHLSSSIYE